MEPVLIRLADLARMNNSCLDLWPSFDGPSSHRLLLEVLTLCLHVTRQQSPHGDYERTTKRNVLKGGFLGLN